MYVPATMRLLIEIVETGVVPVETAYAVTPALREWYVEGDDDELEYAAMTYAARASLQLLAQRGDEPPCRVVLALDVADEGASAAPHADRAAVRLTARPALADVVSAHVDSTDAAYAVRAAVSALPAAQQGDEDAQFRVDAVEDHDLAWYATQEIPALVAVES